MRVMKKRQEADKIKVKAFERDYSHALKTVVDNHAQQVGKMKKRDKVHESGVKRAKSLKDAAKTKAANAVITASKAEMVAETSAKQREKTKRKATKEIRRQTDTKKQKATGLLQMTIDLSIYSNN